MRTRLCLSVVAGFTLAVAPRAWAQEAIPACPNPDARARAAVAQTELADFTWLEGTWQGKGPGGAMAEAHYLAPRANALVSVFRLTTDEATLLLETVTLVQEENDIKLYVRHFDPRLVPLEERQALELRLTARSGDRFIFENVYDENPRCSILERRGPDRMLGWSLLLRPDGSTDEIRVEYEKAGGH